MKKLYFCWEKCSLGWTPVVYHDEPPPKTSPNGQRPEYQSLVLLTTDFIGPHDEPLFGKIIKAYPKPE